MQQSLSESTPPTKHANFDHVRVGVREKPLADGDAPHVQVVLRRDADRVVAYYPGAKEGLVYGHDYFFPADATQGDVFNSIGSEMVGLAMNGFSTCCIATGAAGTGKTHTLFGSDQEAGLIQFVSREMLRRMEAAAAQYEFRVVLSYFEVNCDAVCDALSDATTPGALAVPVGPQYVEAPRLRLRKDTLFGGYTVGGLKEVEVTNWEQLDELLMQGNLRRIELAKQRHARWHGFVRFAIERTPRDAPTATTRSTVTFVHMKGQERAAAGLTDDAQRQTALINRSISLLNSSVLHCVDFRRKSLEAARNGTTEALGQLIDRSQSFFMESKFTQLLGYAVSGRVATFMLATVSATDYHGTTDTLEGLQNAQQLTACVPSVVATTEYGKLARKLEAAEAEMFAAGGTAEDDGHPLTEIEEQVQHLRRRLEGHDFEEELVAVSDAPHIPMSIPADLQRWKQDSLRAQMHGGRAMVYVPKSSAVRSPSTSTASRAKQLYGSAAPPAPAPVGGKLAVKMHETYQGEWARGLKEGLGERITTKSKYLGSWVGGLYEGVGTLWTRDSESAPWVRVYKGEWRAGKRHGKGVQWGPDGEVYEGCFVDGERSITGTLYLANGDRVSGQFANGKAEGQAKLFCQNGDWFEGIWRDGLREGDGVWHYEARQQEYRGTWHKGVAKCGVMLDKHGKATSQASTFLPRCFLADPDAVLNAQRAALEEKRRALNPVSQSQLGY